MRPIEEALSKIDNCAEVLDLMEKKGADFLTTECASMLGGWLHLELTSQTEAIRQELQRSGRKIA